MSSGAEVETPSAFESVDSLIAAVAAAPPRPPPSGVTTSLFVAGSDVGRYRLVREVGRGGMGSVWEATHRLTGKRVALKVVRDGLALTPELKQRFEREARLVTTIRHPGVVPVHDVFEAEHRWPVLVMDFLDGETLGEWLSSERREFADACAILAEVVAIVAAAHRAGVVHRDLKPDNIFLMSEPSNASPRVRVLDFGIARSLGAAAGSPDETLTATGTLLGTPQYMAPEQLLGEEHIDERADVWALGVVLYECVTGKRPIAGGNVGRVLHNLTEHGVPRFDRRQFPPSIAELLRGMLVHDRAHRVRDLAVVERTLRSAARGDCATGFWRALRLRSVETRPSWSVVAGVALASLAGLVAFRSPIRGGATPSPPALAHRTDPRPALDVPRELTFATLLGKATPGGRLIEAWRRSLALRTAGKLDVSVRWGGNGAFRGDERSLLSRLRTGQLDGALVSAKSLPSVLPSVAALQIPGVVDSWTKVEWVQGHLRDEMQSGFASVGYRLLSWQDEGCTRFMSRGRPVRRPADLAWRRMAAVDSDPFAPMFYSSIPGIIPINLAELDVADALHAGPRVGASVVVGTAGDAERLDWIRSLDSVTTMPVACTSGALLLQKGTYERLDPEVRAVVDDLSSRAEDEGASRVRQDDTAASVRLFRGLAPVEPTASERREWRTFFGKAAEERTGSHLARGLVEDVLGLTHEIDAVE